MKVSDPLLDLLGVGQLVFTHLEGKMTTVDELCLCYPCNISVFVKLCHSYPWLLALGEQTCPLE